MDLRPKVRADEAARNHLPGGLAHSFQTGRRAIECEGEDAVVDTSVHL
jgi:hypothetical protein